MLVPMFTTQYAYNSKMLEILNKSFLSGLEILGNGWKCKNVVLNFLQLGISVKEVLTHYRISKNVEPICDKEVLPAGFLSSYEISGEGRGQPFQNVVILWKGLIHQNWLPP